MVSESLARKFRPAGFEQPEGSRHSYTKPSPELHRAFQEWVEELPEGDLERDEVEKQYKKAKRFIKWVGEISADQANSLLFGFRPETLGQRAVGLFVSACYTHSREDVIVFDGYFPEIELIGYKTKKPIFNNGVLGSDFARNSSGLAVNNNECGSWFARGSSGFVVNNRETRHFYGYMSSGINVNNSRCLESFADESSGISVNNGECGVNFGFNSSSGTTIAIKEPKGYDSMSRALILKPADLERIPELKDYLEELCESSRGLKDGESAKRFVKQYGAGGWRAEYKIEDVLIKNRLKSSNFASRIYRLLKRSI